ncbi:MAG: NHL repeat-containing protein [Candidatus Dadabacteria bacterium]|nr:NHL repeat-containing protein [Candidatus Dadabacteria bacterium]
MSGDQPIVSSRVTLFRTGTAKGIKELGSAVSDSTGFFSISYNAPSDPNAVLYLTADNDLISLSLQTRSSDLNSVRLATVLGQLPVQSEIVINERTTVATAYAMAQFFTPDGIDGTYPGLQNAAATAQNLVDLSNGDIGQVLDSFPNGASTSTRATLNALANMLASCVRSEANCDSLFNQATPPEGIPPANTLEAAVNIAHFPWQNVTELFTLSQDEIVYEPVLTSDAELTAWTLALRYQGNGMELNGPGNIAFDKDGNAWIVNNYVFQLDPQDPEGRVCGDDHLLKFTPTGEDFPDAPYQGGGVYGAGFGVTLDPEGNVWVGNFGFQGANCPLVFEELSRTVSKFAADGTPISPDSQGNEMGQDHGGFRGAGKTINQPQGIVSDRGGNIWIANCSGDSVTQFPEGKPELAFALQPLDDMGDSLIIKPFDIAIDVDGNAWVTGNESHSVIAFDTDGNLIRSVTGMKANGAGIISPMGVASDSLGNIWVSNSGIVRAPCDGTAPPTWIQVLELSLAAGFSGKNASVTLINADGDPVGPFKGGGLLIPWGIAVDGNDNVWVANFQGRAVSQLCGAAPENCPPGSQTGDPISPDGGYFFDGLVRNTGVQIDPSGNVWLANNWEIIADPENPGGKELVVFIGLAKPVQAPLIGPPQK